MRGKKMQQVCTLVINRKARKAKNHNKNSKGEQEEATKTIKKNHNKHTFLMQICPGRVIIRVSLKRKGKKALLKTDRMVQPHKKGRVANHGKHSRENSIQKNKRKHQKHIIVRKDNNERGHMATNHHIQGKREGTANTQTPNTKHHTMGTDGSGVHPCLFALQQRVTSALVVVRIQCAGPWPLILERKGRGTIFKQTESSWLFFSSGGLFAPTVSRQGRFGR